MSNLTLELEGHLAVITLQRPERRNALSFDLMLEMAAALDAIASNSNVRAAIIQAAGKVFSSGHDLGEMTGRSVEDYRRIFDICTELMYSNSVVKSAPTGIDRWPIKREIGRSQQMVKFLRHVKDTNRPF